MASDQYKYDVFISYAIEDKISIVNELVQKLEECGVRVWYASQKLRVGYGVQETIKEGLNRSRHGILILSHNFFAKEWPKKELHVLWAKESGFERKLLPVWHAIDEDEIRKHDFLLANSYGLETNKGVDYVVRKLVSEIREKDVQHEKSPKKAIPAINQKFIIGAIAFVIMAALIAYFFFINDVPSDPFIRSTQDDRIEVKYIIVNTLPAGLQLMKEEQANKYILITNKNDKSYIHVNTFPSETEEQKSEIRPLNTSRYSRYEEDNDTWILCNH